MLDGLAPGDVSDGHPHRPPRSPYLCLFAVVKRIVDA
jgi:hypothetical protein